MSQRLKFRVWDQLNKSFIYPDKGYQGHYILTLDGRFQNLQNGSGGDEYVVQQYTGLTDAKDKKIYEGDIINFAYTPKTTFTGHVKWFNDRGSFGVTVDNAFVIMEELLDYWESVEVIGNIFKQESALDELTKIAQEHNLY
jgi:uncharacterized phage protein (TIGR01671 family)